MLINKLDRLLIDNNPIPLDTELFFLMLDWDGFNFDSLLDDNETFDSLMASGEDKWTEFINLFTENMPFDNCLFIIPDATIKNSIQKSKEDDRPRLGGHSALAAVYCSVRFDRAYIVPIYLEEVDGSSSYEAYDDSLFEFIRANDDLNDNPDYNSAIKESLIKAFLILRFTLVKGNNYQSDDIITRRIKTKNNGEKQIIKSKSPITYVDFSKKVKPAITSPISGNTIKFSCRFAVRGHWRDIKGIGKDRNGEYNQFGRTWIVPHERGDGPLKNQIRVVV